MHPKVSIRRNSNPKLKEKLRFKKLNRDDLSSSHPDQGKEEVGSTSLRGVSLLHYSLPIYAPTFESESRFYQ